MTEGIDRQSIAEMRAVIAPYVRVTPTVVVSGAPGGAREDLRAHGVVAGESRADPRVRRRPGDRRRPLRRRARGQRGVGRADGRAPRAFAAVLSGAYVPRAGERIGIVVSGGNSTAVDFEGA